MPETRGSWNLDEAIMARWRSSNLDTLFRAQWGSSGTGKLAFNDSEARPNTPYPYCVYEKDKEKTLSRMSGKTVDTENYILSCQVQFSIFAATKSRAKDFAKIVGSAFDKSALVMQDDDHLTTIRLADWCMREGTTHWRWVLLYEFRYDATYANRLT